MTDTLDFFRGRLDQMIASNHPLRALEAHMPWDQIEAVLAHRFAPTPRWGKQKKGMDLFGPTAVSAVAAG